MKVIISVFLSIIFACVPCFAYTADSFVIDTDPYVFNQVKTAAIKSSAPVMTVGDVAAVAATDDDHLSLPDHLTYTGMFSAACVWEPATVIPFVKEITRSPSIIYSSEYVGTSTFPFYQTDITDEYPSVEYVSGFGFGIVDAIWGFDIPATTAVEITGNIYCYSGYGGIGFAKNLDIYVNDVLVETLQPTSGVNFEFNNFLYQSTADPITKVSFKFYGFPGRSISFDGDYPPDITANCNIGISKPFKIAVVEDTNILDGFNGQAQNDINNHNAIESQWTGSMSQNFSDLNLDDFTFPVGVVSAFSLISGIFSDLWNSMGDFKITYVFPLYLGIVLLLVGRLSKFSGGRSSSGKGKSDDNA